MMATAGWMTSSCRVGNGRSLSVISGKFGDAMKEVEAKEDVD